MRSQLLTSVIIQIFARNFKSKIHVCTWAWGGSDKIWPFSPRILLRTRTSSRADPVLGLNPTALVGGI